MQGPTSGDSMVAFANSIILTSVGRTTTAADFDNSYTYAASGGTDVAQLFGTSGVDNYYRSSTYRILYGVGYAN